MSKIQENLTSESIPSIVLDSSQPIKGNINSSSTWKKQIRLSSLKHK